MIVTRLMGGLGNQMFQYAAGKTLALKHGVELFVDESFLKKDPLGNYTRRDPELQQLNIKAGIADQRLLRTFEPAGSFKKLFSWGRSNPEIIVESEIPSKAFTEAGSRSYLNGYWQSEYYFDSVRNDLLKEFTPAYNLEDEARKYIEQVTSCNSAAVHIRRGDYVSHAGANAFHGVLPEQYYLKSMELLRQKQNTVHFFIFSDDIPWCKNTFAGNKDVTFVESKSSHSFTDLFIMKNCSHNIIANSSYSWWAAWLNENREKVTIAPANWFQDNSRDNENIYCKNWIRI